MIPAPPEANKRVRRSRSTPALPRRSPRDLMGLTVRYRGGPEAWWEVHARGRVWRFPGYVCLHDALSTIYEGRGGHEERRGR